MTTGSLIINIKAPRTLVVTHLLQSLFCNIQTTRVCSKNKTIFIKNKAYLQSRFGFCTHSLRNQVLKVDIVDAVSVENNDDDDYGRKENENGKLENVERSVFQFNPQAICSLSKYSEA